MKQDYSGGARLQFIHFDQNVSLKNIGCKIHQVAWQSLFRNRHQSSSTYFYFIQETLL